VSFNVSDKVVCVDASPWKCGGFLRGMTIPLVQGAVYVVRYYSERTGLYLVGVTMPIHPWTGNEVGFIESRFRKLEEVQAENRAKIAQEATA
jgi:hypothetical protein